MDNIWIYIYFRNNVPISDALSDVLESFNTNLENVQNCAIVSIDLRKTFVTIMIF